MCFLHYEATKNLFKLAKEAPYLNKVNFLHNERIKRFSLRFDEWKLLYTTERVDDAICHALSSLAEEGNVLEKMKNMQCMEIVNYIHPFDSEQRSVGHTAIRVPYSTHQKWPEKVLHVAKMYHEEMCKLECFLQKPEVESCSSMIVIGIGGSFLGTKAVYHALQHSSFACKSKRKVFFSSNIDPDKLASILLQVDLSKTLVAIISKSGTTLEIKAQEELLRKHFSSVGLLPNRQFILVSEKKMEDQKKEEYLESFVLWDYIGGRFSVSSMVGALPIAFALGIPLWQEFLRGLHAMDMHALQEQDPRKNLPLWGALLGIWNRNFLHQSSLAIIPYSSGLDFWTEHLQQLFMESNGKSIAQDGGTLLDYSTVPIIWGSVGTEGQHAYYQAIHQGTDSIPLEFIAFLDSQMNRDGESNGSTNQEKLLASALAQMLALAIGSQDENPNKMCRGNRPSHLLIANKLNPYSLGELLAYHEHYVAFQGFLWGINSFDQEGVQLGKKLTQQLLNIWRSHKPSLKSDQDICAKTLIDEVQKMKKKCSRCE